eukprot:7950787-Alexandrium_andersonii.AAC.1
MAGGEISLRKLLSHAQRLRKLRAAKDRSTRDRQNYAACRASFTTLAVEAGIVLEEGQDCVTVVHDALQQSLRSHAESRQQEW